ncbi:hypothetical protein COCCADRAFT_41418 [Bipolaris zeicola 26-R-13]|uniref:Uncharacterized protein n=1 Tax=Cochliobolus carbonum (strain 26-R-13) TaxID=930089 RepID=W6XRN3_COCC2|nr:uncharacterized protein COCCADRAFT_41418 [Bipolaris zeicola 26-R-13]EUC27980.1 hypothetical protein COCCADRAFT_41418 [Bipolaris zeicola 26-R-13]
MKRMKKSHVKLGFETSPPSPIVAKEITLRSHIQELLDKLPQNLPTYYHEELIGRCHRNTSRIYLTLALDRICFLLHSPLFSYVVGPRIWRAEQKAQSSETQAATTQTPIVKNTHEGVIREPATYPALSKLRIDIKQEKDDWVEDSSFVMSFCFFCEEVAFLSSEFRSRERAGAILRGTAGEQDRCGEEEAAPCQVEGKKYNDA